MSPSSKVFTKLLDRCILLWPEQRSTVECRRFKRNNSVLHQGNPRQMACLRHQSERFVEVYAADHAWSWTKKIDNMTSNAGYKKKICYYYDGMLKFILLSSFKVIRLICVFISSSVAHKRFDTTQRKWLINRFVFQKSVRHQSCHLLNSRSLYKYFEVPHQNQGRTIRVYTCGPIYSCEDIF